MKRATKTEAEPVTKSTVLVNGIPTEILSTQCVRVNLMSRKEYVEDKDTPICCSPAFETYWSM